ncbi:hypothetical protein HL92_003334 [Salmonella enterica]|nr:hypothetical protein [Salmonella enterica]
MRKPEVLYKQPLLCHISGAGSTFFAGSGIRLATPRNLPDGGGKRFIRPMRVIRRPGKRRATGHVAG